MKILIISLAGIGDTLLATPLIHECRAHYPQATIEAFVFWPGARDLLEDNPHLHAIHQKNLVKAGRLGSLRFILKLRRQRYDITINTHPQSRIHYRLLAWLIHAPIRISHRYDRDTWLDRRLVNRTLPQDYSIHCIDNNLRLLTLLDKKPTLPSHDFEVFLADAETQWAGDFLALNNLTHRTRLGLHVGSGGTKNLTLKRWPLDHYIQLIRQLCQSHPRLAILLFGGPEEEQDHARIIQAAGNTQVFLARTKNLRQAATLLKECHAFLSVDTALMHLAAAMKVPNQIVIEAPTLNATNVPYRNPYRVVKNPAVAGRNLDFYRYDGRPIQGSRQELLRCMASVPVDEVCRVLREVLPGHGGGP